MVKLGLHALASIYFPVRPGQLELADACDLASALQQVGRAIAAGHHAQTGTILVPYQERGSMKVSMQILGANRKKYWNFNMEYDNLSPQYAVEVAGPAKSFAAAIDNTAGEATGDDPAYTVLFEFEVDQNLMRGMPEPFAAVFKHKAKSENLRFSQAVGFQDAGLQLLLQLNQGAHREIASGERK